MNKKAEFVIIGGGIVGSALAAELALHSKNVIVIDKKGVSEYASSSNFGMVWLQTRFPGYDTMMSRQSQSVYEKKILEDFNIDIEYEKLGGLTIAFSDIQLEVMKKQCHEKQKEGTPMAMIDKVDALRLEPYLNPEIVGAIFCPEDARVNPMLATMAFADLARRRGVEIIKGEAVIDIISEKNKISGVITEKQKIDTPCVINAAGVWARQIASMVNIDLPVFPQRLQGVVTEPVHPMMRRIVQVARDVEEGMDPEKATGFMFEYEGEPTEENLPKLPVEDTIFTYIQQTLSDTVAIGTTNEFVGYDTRSTPQALSAMLSGAVRICPSIKYVNIIRSWASLVPFTYDGMPVIGPVEELEGFLFATGHGHAMCHAPALAEQIVNWITGKRDIPNLDVIGYDRFYKEI